MERVVFYAPAEKPVQKRYRLDFAYGGAWLVFGSYRSLRRAKAEARSIAGMRGQARVVDTDPDMGW